MSVTVNFAAAQSTSRDTLSREPLLRKSSLIIIPILYYTPETRWAGGAAGLYTFHFRGQPERLRPSQLQLGFAYTQEKQILAYFPFQIFLDDERGQINGELGYYRYTYQFFGIGNGALNRDGENYDVNFPRLRLNMLTLVGPHQYLGLRYWWDDYRIVHTQPNGLLDKATITGSDGGVLSGAGLIWTYDNRDNIFSPAKGLLVKAELFTNQHVLGSDFNFYRQSLDVAAYFSRNTQQVLAVNAWLVFLQGQVPFQQLAFIGGPKKMRGYFEGQLRDKNLWMLQLEYRRKISGRFGFTLFSAIGAVSPIMVSFFHSQVHFTYGAGLRFRLSKTEPINLRLDIGANERGQWFPYLTVREAF